MDAGHVYPEGWNEAIPKGETLADITERTAAGFQIRMMGI